MGSTDSGKTLSFWMTVPTQQNIGWSARTSIRP